MNNLIDEDELFELGYIKNNSIISNNYSLNISRWNGCFKEISIFTDPNSQFIYLREGDLTNRRENDDVITIFNSDFDGELTIDYIEKLTNLLKPNEK